MTTLYTYGYTGGRLADLQAYAAAGALILDTRFSPRSANPAWNGAALGASLPEGRYAWERRLGNVNYRNGGPIQIANPELGLPVIREALAQGPVVLLCACRDAGSCHRSVVAEMARAVGICSNVVHLAPGDPLAKVEAGESGIVNPDRRIRALSLWQPWATLIAIGAKKIETRNWSTPYRGPLAIVATAKWDRDVLDDLVGDPLPEWALARQMLVAAGYRSLAELPLGKVVAIVDLVSCTPVEEISVSDQEKAFGDYSEGRYGWVLENVRRLETPIPARGAQGLWWWDVPEDCEVTL